MRPKNKTQAPTNEPHNPKSSPIFVPEEACRGGASEEPFEGGVGCPSTTGTVVDPVIIKYDAPEITVGLPLSSGSFGLARTVVGGITTSKEPSTSVVDPGNDSVTWFIGTVVTLDTMTLVTPLITVVLPAIGAAGLTGTIVSPLTTTAVFPSITTGAGTWVAPIPLAIADATAPASFGGAAGCAAGG